MSLEFKDKLTHRYYLESVTLQQEVVRLKKEHQDMLNLMDETHNKEVRNLTDPRIARLQEHNKNLQDLLALLFPTILEAAKDARDNSKTTEKTSET